MFASVDMNGDGAVTREEFVKAILAGNKPAVAADNKEADNASKTESNRDRHPQEREGHGRGGHRRGEAGSGPGRIGHNGPWQAGPPSANDIMERFDKSHKGSLSKSDVPERLWERMLSKADANHDGVVTKDELEAHLKTIRPRTTPAGNEAKPAETPPASKAPDAKPDEPKPAKPDEAKPTANLIDRELPADASTAVNVAALE